jgi:hypothetical protein
MNRADLESLDRSALIARAEEAGVSRARILTRPELVDELLLRSFGDEPSRRRARGLFGVARDLIARVVERGLHLPDAAERIRTLEIPAPPRQSAPAALPTVTLAEIYAAQGHRERAIETLESVLVREPDHSAAQALLEQLRDEAFAVPQPRLPPEPEDTILPAPDEPRDLGVEAQRPSYEPPEEPPASVDFDECIAIPVDATSLYVYWAARRRTLDQLQERHAHGGPVLRLLVIAPEWDGPRRSIRDQSIDASKGEVIVRELPAACVVRAAIGWRSAETFESIAHSPALETPTHQFPQFESDTLLRWTPAGKSRVIPSDPDARSIERALTLLRNGTVRTASGLVP